MGMGPWSAKTQRSQCWLYYIRHETCDFLICSAVKLLLTYLLTYLLILVYYTYGANRRKETTLMTIEVAANSALYDSLLSSSVPCCFRQWLVPRVESIKFANLTLWYCHKWLAYRRGGLDYGGPTGKLLSRKPSLYFHLRRQQWLSCETNVTVLYAVLFSRFPRFFFFSFLFTLLSVPFSP